jgi:HPt (histidine-containing phosphotransfer) domain-containing protein
VDRSDLIALLWRHLKSNPPSPPPGGAQGSTADNLTTGGPIRSELRFDPELQKFFGDFVRGLPEVVCRLRSQIEQENMALLRDALHQLKGTAGMFGFPQITAGAEAAQQHLDRGGTIEAIARQIRELVGLVRQVEGYDALLEQPTSAGASPDSMSGR